MNHFNSSAFRFNVSLLPHHSNQNIKTNLHMIKTIVHSAGGGYGGGGGRAGAGMYHTSCSTGGVGATAFIPSFFSGCLGPGCNCHDVTTIDVRGGVEFTPRSSVWRWQRRSERQCRVRCLCKSWRGRSLALRWWRRRPTARGGARATSSAAAPTPPVLQDVWYMPAPALPPRQPPPPPQPPPAE